MKIRLGNIKKKISRRKKFFFREIQGVMQSISQYIYEMLTLFDKSIRVSFTNFPHGEKQEASPFLKLFKKNCPQFEFKFVKYCNPHIQLFSVYGKIKELKNSKAPVKIFFTGENVNCGHNSLYQGNCIDIVDLSIGFDFITTNNYIRDPLWMFYFFPFDSSKDDIRNILDNFKLAKEKTKFCALISRHDNHGLKGLRTRIYNEVSCISHVDSPGRLLHNDDTLHKNFNNDKDLYLQQYKFNICPENSISEGYVTEKIFQSLYSGCIPIYSGWNKDPEPGIINPNIIMWYDVTDMENNKHTMNEIRRLHENDKLYRSFVDQPFFCDTAVDRIHNFNTKLNEKLRELLQTKLSRC